MREKQTESITMAFVTIRLELFLSIRNAKGQC
jgi:hypothetical protein